MPDKDKISEIIEILLNDAMYDITLKQAKAKIAQLLLEERNRTIKRIYENSMYGEDKTAKDVQERLEAALEEKS